MTFRARKVTSTFTGNKKLKSDYVSFSNGGTVMVTGSKCVTSVFQPKVVVGANVGTATWAYFSVMVDKRTSSDFGIGLCYYLEFSQTSSMILAECFTFKKHIMLNETHGIHH